MIEVFLYQWFLFLFFALSGTSLAASMKVVKQGDQALVEHLGRYNGKKLEPGLTFLVPFFEQVAYKDTLREQPLEMKPLACLTSDRITVTLDMIVYWQILDLEKSCYKVKNLRQAVIDLIEINIRTELATVELNDLFTVRDQLNETLVQKLDVATEPWGIKITRVQLRQFQIGEPLRHEALKPLLVQNASANLSLQSTHSNS
ncbi:MAG: paraslipin [Roseofilum sp. SBFL]|uniref:SPFH domain-containing protein n=1 Tax=unclassified Roseofilum TaxID=2620099 RepID=UPI001B221BFE|nr:MULTISPECIES: paraslipin [unclassified Roseofilum]MBP0015800.1 paraslipin [Roseofilum sp. SID3]MBP0023065.1 paraslipin [Roseofilum sp. SID2]MBP0039090.1 paraslipin [Roseofilum sp. SID1]MBP0041247.1 paraslipin [Roseofilum sp. SBFL]